MHTGLPVAGYQPQSDDKVALVNANKRIEETILRQMDDLQKVAGADLRWLAIARTQIEQGFMALNRAIFQPSRVKLEGDPQ